MHAAAEVLDQSSAVYSASQQDLMETDPPSLPSANPSFSQSRMISFSFFSNHFLFISKKDN